MCFNVALGRQLARDLWPLGGETASKNGETRARGMPEPVWNGGTGDWFHRIWCMYLRFLGSFFYLLCLLMCGKGAADPVDELIQKQMTEHRIPGLALTIIQKG